LAQVALGSLPELRQAVARSGRRFDILLANILLDVLIGLVEGGAAECLTPDGVMILSGILDVQEADLLGACDAAGLVLVESRAEADWRALVVKRKPPHDERGGENHRR
jgi:ribosomal protein L11 methyltransferase